MRNNYLDITDEPNMRNSLQSYRYVVTEADIKRGYVVRYFVQKRNEPKRFVELSKDSYNSNDIDEVMWKRGSIKWSLTDDGINVTTLALMEVDYPTIRKSFI